MSSPKEENKHSVVYTNKHVLHAHATRDHTLLKHAELIDDLTRCFNYEFSTPMWWFAPAENGGLGIDVIACDAQSCAVAFSPKTRLMSVAFDIVASRQPNELPRAARIDGLHHSLWPCHWRSDRKLRDCVLFKKSTRFDVAVKAFGAKWTTTAITLLRIVLQQNGFVDDAGYNLHLKTEELRRAMPPPPPPVLTYFPREYDVPHPQSFLDAHQIDFLERLTAGEYKRSADSLTDLSWFRGTAARLIYTHVPRYITTEAVFFALCGMLSFCKHRVSVALTFEDDGSTTIAAAFVADRLVVRSGVERFTVRMHRPWRIEASALPWAQLRASVIDFARASQVISGGNAPAIEIERGRLVVCKREARGPSSACELLETDDQETGV